MRATILLLALVLLALLFLLLRAWEPTPPRTSAPGPAPLPRESPPPAPPASGVPVPPEPTTPWPAMRRVAAGDYEIGTELPRFEALLAGRDASLRDTLRFETPRQVRHVDAFWIDTTEVTNAQYLVFLEDAHAPTWDTDDRSLATLPDVAAHLLGMERDRVHEDDVAWRQLYSHNKLRLWARMPTVRVLVAGEVDERATEEAFRLVTLAPGIELRFFDLLPPRDWWPDLSADPIAGIERRPVRWVSYDDAEAFALWAGKHVPTEFEWEVAAAGAEGFSFPWGEDWASDGSRANWGGWYRPDGAFPGPLDVGSLPAGASPCGCLDMLGNVAEWTSSWFAAYSGNGADHPFLDENGYVKVIRGGAYNDQELLVLRNQARNFIARAPEAPPVPGNWFETVGFRCAWYETPGLDRAGPLLRQIVRGRRVDEEDFALDRVAGRATGVFVSADLAPPDGVTVPRRARAITLVPLALLSSGGWEPPRIRSRADLLALSSPSRESSDPILLAAFQTDIAFTQVLVARPLTDAEQTESEKARRKGKLLPPQVVEGTLAPGTYLLALWYGRLAVVEANLDFVAFLTPDGEPPLVEEGEAGAVAPPPSVLSVDPAEDLVDLAFSVGSRARKPTDPAAFRIRVVLHAEPATLDAAGLWR